MIYNSPNIMKGSSARRETRLMKKIRNFIINLVRHNNFFSHLVWIVYYIFSQEIVSSLISVIGTVVIAVKIGKNEYDALFIFLVVIYIIGLFLTALAHNYARNKITNFNLFKQSLYGIDETLKAWADSLKISAEHIYNARPKDRIQPFLEYVDFQTAAFFVCQKLNSNLKVVCRNENVYITVYQKYNIQGKTGVQSEYCKCKMIGYSDNHEPASFNTKYDVPDFDPKLKKKIPFHSYLFSSGKNDIVALSDRKGIDEWFLEHDENAERESKIQQYIGIPISLPKLGVIVLLQIDTPVPKLFGKNEEEMKEFAKVGIYPYAQFLYMAYEQSRATQALIERSNDDDDKKNLSFR